MDRHILGTFKNEREAVLQVETLLNEEGYKASELMLLMAKTNQNDVKIESLKNVKVNKVELEDESIWDKVKEAFSFGSYDSDENNSTLEKYGVPHDRSDHYMDALKDGEIVLLADTDAPKQGDLSEVNEDIIVNEEREKIMTEKQNNPINEVNSEESEAIVDKKPSDVDTSENKDLNESVDPSQVNQTRSDADSESKDFGNNEETQGTESEEKPDLTGEEDTIETEGSDHGYGNTIAKGVVKPKAVSPLNTDEKSERNPQDNTEAPESEANYSEELEEQGKKSLDDNK
ncbi:general stress protein [Alkalibacterium sp. f15]|uniref:general stress protein n=1 Tax=Alkalibacterium sp. f15 TaxID=3414029 RepID=UPI003BF81126